MAKHGGTDKLFALCHTLKLDFGIFIGKTSAWDRQ